MKGRVKQGGNSAQSAVGCNSRALARFPCHTFQILRSKFDEFKRTVEAGTERFNMCERQARYLTDDRGDHTGEVIERQEHIRWVDL